MKPIFMTARVLRRSWRNYPTNFLVLPKVLRMVAIEEALQIRYLTNSNGDLKSFSDLMNARQSLKSFRNDGLLKEHSHGWKTSEG